MTFVGTFRGYSLKQVSESPHASSPELSDVLSPKNSARCAGGGRLLCFFSGLTMFFLFCRGVLSRGVCQTSWFFFRINFHFCHTFMFLEQNEFLQNQAKV